MHAVIVGGGIGGLAAAAGLHQRGWSVTVLEQTAEFAVVGAGISLWANAFRALDTVGVTLGAERFDASGGLRDWRGRWIARMDGAPELARPVLAHRNDLRNALLERVPAACQVAGARVEAVRVEGARAVVTHGGGEVTADLVIGADGVHSAVRRSLWPEAATPAYSGQSVWRAVLPTELTDIDHWAETWGPGAVFGMFPMSGGLLYYYGSGAAPEAAHSPDGELAELHRRFGDWCEPIPAVLAATRAEQVLRNDVYHLPPLKTYTKGPVVLLGDAAHAMTPNLGQGGCQALEDAATLSLALETLPDVPTALRRYDELRRPRTQALARKALAIRSMSHLSFAPARIARNALIRALPSGVMNKSFTQPLDWRPEDGLVRT